MSVLEKCKQKDLTKWQECLKSQIQKKKNKINDLEKDIKILKSQLKVSKSESFLEN